MLTKIPNPYYVRMSRRNFYHPPPLPPPLELATASRACCRLQSLLPPSELATACRACCRLENLLPLPKFATTSRRSRCLQTLLPPPKLDNQDREQNPDLKQGQHASKRPTSRLHELGEPETHLRGRRLTVPNACDRSTDRPTRPTCR